MKKLTYFSAALVCAGMIAACSPAESTTHGLTVAYPAGEREVYADATLDSLRFITFDSWKVTIDNEWIHANSKDMSNTVPPGYMEVKSIKLNMDPNTTGLDRTGYLTINAYRTHRIPYTQLGYLNITRPLYNKETLFTVRDSANAKLDSISFDVSGNWTLAFKEEKEWIAFAEEATLSGAPGKHTVVYQLKDNNSGANREAVIQLTSKTVCTNIKVVQTTGLKK